MLGNLHEQHEARAEYGFQRIICLRT